MVLDQIKEQKFTYVPGRRQNRRFVKNAALAIARGLAIKEPSFKANGRLRGKQPRCTEKACKEPAAIGVRYASSLGLEKACACASCWSAVVLRRRCDFIFLAVKQKHTSKMWGSVA